MITVRCSQLEQIRKDPTAYGQILAAGDAQNGSGTHGMFAYFKDVARTVHLKERTISEAIKELQSKFIRFADNPTNRHKQEVLLEQFVRYQKTFDKMDFVLVDGNRQIKWHLIPEGKLTGLTPWVAENEDGFFAYVISQKGFDWQRELRFPIFQKYISENTIHCNPTEIKLGIYNMESSEFEFKCFNTKELTNCIMETSNILQTVSEAYNRKKKK